MQSSGRQNKSEATYAGAGMILATAVMVFVAVAPTLSWPQFSGDSEDLVVQTVLEMRNGGPWWVPRLENQPRIRKPPLTVWLRAAAARASTIQQLHSTGIQREAAYANLAWEMRWPSLLAGCLMLIFVGLTGQILGPGRLGPAATLVCGSMLLFLRFTRSATTDIDLALWVSAANFFLALALVRGRRWTGCVGAGAALGLALMTKGPVGLLFSVPPVALFAFYARRGLRSAPSGHAAPRRGLPGLVGGGWGWPLLAGLGLMLVIALPWPLSVLFLHNTSLHAWSNEFTNEGAGVELGDPWTAYLSLFPMLLPWVVFFIAGIILAWAKRRRRLGLALFWVVVSIVVMSCFPTRKTRYLLPMCGPMAILAAYAALAASRGRVSRWRTSRIVVIAHWATLAILAVGLPIAAAKFLVNPDAQPWVSWPAAGITLALALPALGIAIFLQRRRVLHALIAAAVLMLLLNTLFYRGWSGSLEGQSEMKSLADAILLLYPQAHVFYYDPPPGGKPVTLDLDIYLDHPVTVVSAPPALAGEGTKVVVMLRRKNAPEPALPGYDLAFQLITPKHHYQWYVLASGKS